MLKIGTLVAAIATSLALPAVAGSWPPIPARKAAPQAAAPRVVAPQSVDGFVTQPGDSMSSLEQYRYFPNEEKTHGRKSFAFDAAPASTPAPVQAANRSVAGFEYVAGEPGWQLSQHKYVLSGGRFAHSEECDHVIRSAQAPTRQEVDRLRRFSPGA